MTNFLKIMISILSSFILCFFIYILFLTDVIIIDESKILILFFIVFITFFLLILSILLLFGRSKLEITRGNLSLLTASILEEMINSKSKTDLERIKKNLKNKKENIYKLLKIDSKKIGKRNFKAIEEQLNLIFNKIEENLGQKLEGQIGNTILGKVEMLLEKLMTVITEKGIQINTPINNAAINQNYNSQKYDELKNIKDISKVEELLEMEEIIEPEKVIEDEKINNLEEIREVNNIHNEDALNDSGNIEEIPEFENPDQQQKIENNQDFNESFEIEEIKNFTAIPDENQFSNEVDIVEKVQDINIETEEHDIEFDINNNDIEFENLETFTENVTDKNEVPRVPEEFYMNNEKNDELADQIKELTNDKNNIKPILKEIYQDFHADKLSLLINEKNKNYFIQINQIGSDQNKIKNIVLKEDNKLIQHINNTQRIVYITKVEKIKDIFNFKDFEKYYSDMRSLFIYPIIHHNKITSLILLFFKTDKTGMLEELIEGFEKYNNKLKSNISRLL